MPSRRTCVRVSPLTNFFCAGNFGFVRLFSQIFLMSPKGPPFNFFNILQQSGRSKNPKGPPFYIFWHYATHWGLQKNFKKKFGKIFLSFFPYFDIVRLLLDKKKFPQRFRLHFSGVLRQNGC